MIFLLVLLSVQTAFADYLERSQCPTTDLSKQFGPVHHQLDTGWCWGFAAQDLMSFAAGRMDDPYSTQDVVATTLTTDAAALNAYADKQSGFDEKYQAKRAAAEQKYLLGSKRGRKPKLKGNGIQTAVTAYSARGSYCTVKQSGLSQPDASVVDRRQFAKPFLSHLQRVNQSLVPSSLRKMKKFTEPALRTPNALEVEVQGLLPICDSPAAGASRFAELRAALNDKAVFDFRETVDRACGERTSGPEFVANTRNYDPDGTWSNRTSADLAESLGRGVPAGIEYNAGFLMKNGEPGKEYGHASIVVGSRWDEKTGMCEFKIRNSWGTNCSLYPAAYASPDKCDNGNVWVRERDVLFNVWATTTVRKK